MLSGLRKWLGSAREAARSPSASVPSGQRVYAIGDIHGRLDLFSQLIAAVEADDAARGPAQTTVVLLGDLIDRGPDSAGVVAAAKAWSEQRPLRILMGNHEEMLLGALDRIDVLRGFVNFGGKETILSFGVAPETYNAASWEELQDLLRQAIPAQTLTFISGFESLVRIGDYAFVHAGIRPGVDLEAQTPADLRWIREPFLSSGARHGEVIVHGHTITDAPALRPNRIGIDTGAYASGRLTALVLEGPRRWWLTAEADEAGAIATQLTEAG